MWSKWGKILIEDGAANILPGSVGHPVPSNPITQSQSCSHYVAIISFFFFLNVTYIFF